MSDECKEFKAHQLRPNKCKNCFGDKERHTSTDEPEPAMSREQLMEELKRCQEERARLSANQRENAHLAEQCKRELDELRSELEQTKKQLGTEDVERHVRELGEQLERALAERDRAREELRSLEREMEEMHDNFKEEESEQFEQVKQELDMAVKNCKILQIRLAKAERQYGQLEQVKSMLERQLDQTRATRRVEAEGEPADAGYVRLSCSEYDQLLRDLNDTSERERDLQEQIKFSQNEAQAKHDRLQMLELENELLMSKLGPSKEKDEQGQVGLALELAQLECRRLLERRKELAEQLESREAALRASEKSREALEAELGHLRAHSDAGALSGGQLELECRQLRARLVRYEREFKQLKGQLEQGHSVRARGEQIADTELVRQRARADQLAAKLEQVGADLTHSKVESDLIEGLKRRLETSETELARARARLVELDLECSRAQRQHKRLVESLASSKGELQLCKRVKLPEESARDSMSRQELRQALSALEQELVQYGELVSSKDCLIRELQSGSPSRTPQEDQSGQKLSKALEQECQNSAQLRQQLAALQQGRAEMQASISKMQAERAALEDEVSRLRQANADLRSSLEKAKDEGEQRVKEIQLSCDKLRAEAAKLRPSASQEPGPNSDLLLMSRDLSELRAKNSFLARELDLAREDAARQLEELRRSQETQQRRAIELAQIELKDRQLVEVQALRDELNELRQRLATAQRQSARAEEDVASERERMRALERDWRRDKSQWQQRSEQLEAQLAIERRSSEFKVKEVEAQVRDKERELLSLQESYVQLERDLKRLQNKHRMLEDESESRLSNLTRELEAKKRELAELLASGQLRDEQQHENIKRLSAERATLTDALESARRSYDEKTAEARTLRQQLQARQDQAFKERLSNQERIDSLASELSKAAERETHAKLQCQQLEMRERQLELMRRENGQLKETGSKLRAKCEDLERRCQQYEKQELAAKAISISPAAAASSLLRVRSPFQGQTIKQKQQAASSGSEIGTAPTSTVDKLTGKVNDQRNLINMLRQQHEESQLELRQIQLLRTAERANWESRLTLLTARLAECEERLLFESAGQLSTDMLDSSKRKLEARWADERRATLETVKQQQARCEQLVRDLKKLGQAHELLRHQARQLQALNDKLSRRLIELQQVGRPLASGDQLGALEVERATLREQNERLDRLIREQARPLVLTVSKIMSSLDASDKLPSGQAPGTPTSSGYASAGGEALTQSTSRPLGVVSSAARERRADSEESSGLGQPEVGKASRLSRLLGKSSRPAEEKPEKAGPRTVRRVRVKSAALGISATERRQLRTHLDQLASALEELESSNKSADKPATGRVHWRATRSPADDSDLESERSSQLKAPVKADRYQRFPQSNPGSYGASLTDYDSDLSLASELTGCSARAGAESDGGTQTGPQVKLRKRGLKTRLTSTLRNLSRSITGLTSDSESEQAASKRAELEARQSELDLREIRV